MELTEENIKAFISWLYDQDGFTESMVRSVESFLRKISETHQNADQFSMRLQGMHYNFSFKTFPDFKITELNKSLQCVDSDL